MCSCFVVGVCLKRVLFALCCALFVICWLLCVELSVVLAVCVCLCYGFVFCVRIVGRWLLVVGRCLLVVCCLLFLVCPFVGCSFLLVVC